MPASASTNSSEIQCVDDNLPKSCAPRPLKVIKTMSTWIPKIIITVDLSWGQYLVHAHAEDGGQPTPLHDFIVDAA